MIGRPYTIPPWLGPEPAPFGALCARAAGSTRGVAGIPSFVLSLIDLP
jgi:hypothetical protein